MLKSLKSYEEDCTKRKKENGACHVKKLLIVEISSLIKLFPKTKIMKAFCKKILKSCSHNSNLLNGSLIIIKQKLYFETSRKVAMQTHPACLVAAT